MNECVRVVIVEWICGVGFFQRTIKLEANTLSSSHPEIARYFHERKEGLDGNVQELFARLVSEDQSWVVLN